MMYTINWSGTMIAIATVLIMAFSCDCRVDRQKFEADARERQDMIHAGYVKKLVPGQSSEIWVKDQP
jgi:hypothetical protein